MTRLGLVLNTVPAAQLGTSAHFQGDVKSVSYSTARQEHWEPVKDEELRSASAAVEAELPLEHSFWNKQHMETDPAAESCQDSFPCCEFPPRHRLLHKVA